MPISVNDLNKAKGEARVKLQAARIGDKLGNKVKGRLKWCRWGDREHTTRNISEICDECWSRKLDGKGKTETS